jgi:hypothetical protein
MLALQVPAIGMPPFLYLRNPIKIAEMTINALRTIVDRIATGEYPQLKI